MVYESDFYTTRRPYSRPALSSYSVTSPIRIIPGIARINTLPLYSYGSPLSYRRVVVSRPISMYTSSPMSYVHSLPLYYGSSVSYRPIVVSRPISMYTSSPMSYVRVHTLPLYGAPLVHRRVVVSRPVSLYTPSPMSVVIRTLPSVLDREYDRIEKRVRPSPSYRPVEDYLNSSSAIDFDDETRRIRSQANSLLTRIHTPVHRPLRTIFFSTLGGYGSVYPSYPHLDAELEHIFKPLSKVASDVNSISNYRKNIGGGHLACLRYSGNKAFSKRKSFYPDDDKVRNDVKLLSYYIERRPMPTGLKALELESAKEKTATPATE